MEFFSERLVYREFTKDDFDLFYSVFSNQLVMKYALMDKYNSKSEIIPYFSKVLENNLKAEDRKAYEYAVFLKSNDSFIGFADIEIYIRNSSGGCGEIGYFILPEFWQKGFATEIADKLLEISFNQLNLHRVSARCNSNNLKSEQVMLKTGMINEGECRKARFKDGKWDNEKLYAILVDEWKEKQITRHTANEILKDIVFERACKDDAPGLIEARNKSFFDDFIKFGECPGYNIPLDVMKQMIEYVNIYKIKIRNIIVGDISVHRMEDGLFRIGCLEVIPGFQNKGIGSRTVAFIEKKFPQAREWSLETPVQNYRNCCFYEKLGFIKVYDRIHSDKLTLRTYQKIV
ncbi:MAG: GNAT family N-acetyltransferase [Bacillota bacterium]|nr:GNAT family N-acetyltransferase [Bacillota bacterium]